MSYGAKVSDEQIREIRERAANGEPDRALAPAFALSLDYIRRSRKGLVREEAGGPFTRRRNAPTARRRIAKVESRVDRLEQEVTALRDALDGRVA
jgi:hypothetical protein